MTAYVMTTRWEAAGGAASMPDFYAAIFGTGDDTAPATVGDEKDDGRDRPPAGCAKPLGVGSGSSEGGRGKQLRTGSGVDSGACDAGTACRTGSEPESDHALGYGSVRIAGNLGVSESQTGSAAADKATSAATVVTKGVGGEVGASPSTQQQQQRGKDICRREKAVDVGTGSEGVTGVALQERLMRLRQAFAKEQCGVVLSRAVGW